MKAGWLVAGGVAVLITGGVVAGALNFRSHVVHFTAASDGMEPTLPKGQYVFVATWIYEHAPIQRLDVIAFYSPAHDGKISFGRVEGLPGDKVGVRGGTLVFEDHSIEESFVIKHARYELSVRNYGMYVDGERLDDDAVIPPRSQWSAPDRVPRGCYFVLGDNRNRAIDSHSWGFLCPKQVSRWSGWEPSVVGRVIFFSGL